MVSNNHITALPSLQALRILEAAVRQQSYTAAATELGLTHGAISRQITNIEKWAKSSLFVRRGKQMVPTERALALVTKTREALALLGDAFGHPVLPDTSVGLRVSTTVSIARLWLLPRMAQLEAEHPNLISEIRTTPSLDVGGDSDADCAIRFGSGGWPNVEGHFLGRETLFPVASPELSERTLDWRNERLITTPFQSWQSWFDAASESTPNCKDRSLALPDAALALDAAKAGLGVALARGRFAEADLANGSLIRLEATAVYDIYGYYFVTPRGRVSETSNILREWLAQQFKD
jgi:LysR family transcriptional regulator, glycine cleavage system transcriptional activator